MPPARRGWRGNKQTKRRRELERHRRTETGRAKESHRSRTGRPNSRGETSANKQTNGRTTNKQTSGRTEGLTRERACNKKTNKQTNKQTDHRTTPQGLDPSRTPRPTRGAARREDCSLRRQRLHETLLRCCAARGERAAWCTARVMLCVHRGRLLHAAWRHACAPLLRGPARQRPAPRPRRRRRGPAHAEQSDGI